MLSSVRQRKGQHHLSPGTLLKATVQGVKALLLHAHGPKGNPHQREGTKKVYPWMVREEGSTD